MEGARLYLTIFFVLPFVEAGCKHLNAILCPALPKANVTLLQRTRANCLFNS